MREKMIAWLNEEHPYALPRHRADLGRQAPSMSDQTPAAKRAPRAAAQRSRAKEPA